MCVLHGRTDWKSDAGMRDDANVEDGRNGNIVGGWMELKWINFTGGWWDEMIVSALKNDSIFAESEWKKSD